MDLRYFKNDLDNELLKQLYKEDINEKVTLDLINRGANVNAVDEDDKSLLYNFIVSINDVDEKSIKILQLLLDSGADIHYVNTSGYNCLFPSAVPRRIKIFKFLLKRGINPNCICTERMFGSQFDDIERDEFITRSFSKLPKDEWKVQKNMIRLIKKYDGKRKEDLYMEIIKKY